MTPEEIRRAAANLLAMADGKTLLYRGAEYSCDDMKCDSDIGRVARASIKPEPKLRPWTEAEADAACDRGEIVRSRKGDYRGPLTKSCGKYYVSHQAQCESHALHYLRDNFTIAATGAPCGVLEDQ